MAETIENLMRKTKDGVRLLTKEHEMTNETRKQHKKRNEIHEYVKDD